jgi:hypothetical protein
MHGLASFFGEALQAARPWLQQSFASEEARALLAPWVLHCGLGPDSPLSALMAQVVAFTLEDAAVPCFPGLDECRGEIEVRIVRDGLAGITGTPRRVRRQAG